jgi:hypothetical protein
MILNLIEFFVILTIFPFILSERHHQSSNQLFHILNSLKPIRSQICQFKFENCIQDLSYADQLDNDCNIYSRLRDCFRSLFDDNQCSSSQLKHQYRKIRQKEYDACGLASSYHSVRSSMHTSLSSKLQTTSLITLNLFFISIFFAFI